MFSYRLRRRALALLSLLVFALIVPPFPAGAARATAAAAPVARWEEAPPLALPRSGPRAFLQADGRLLLFGGVSEGQAATEYYDPARGTTGGVGVRGPAGGLALAPLPDGRLLLAGGIITPSYSHTGSVTADTALYDPATGRETPGPRLGIGRTGHTAVALRDGSVLIVGGFTSGGAARSMGIGAIAQAERYDPRAGRWSAAGSLITPRGDHAVVALADGRVLVVGGRAEGGSALATAELYDPATDRWTATGAMAAARLTARLLTLADGTILALGGGEATLERYDPATGRWSAAGELPAPREGFAAALLADGRVLLAGGGPSGAGGYGAESLLFDPARGTWAAGPPLPEARRSAALVALPDGRALLIGGTDPGDEPLATVRLFTAEPPLRERCFAETGQCLRGAFLDAWEARGGLALNGLPLGPEVAETLEDGRVYRVQYCERARFEYHPEAPAPYRVQLGQFGRRVLAARLGAPPTAAPVAGARHFPETGHNVGGDFLAFWEGRGGLAQFGLPLSEEVRETLEDGREYSVQYFERARFERHPAAGGATVELGQFGRAILAENALLDPRLRDRYVAWEALRARLGAPTAAATIVPGATLPFSGGRMLYLAPTKTIVALCQDRQADPAFSPAPRGYVMSGRYALLPDTWDAGQPAGGGRIGDRGEYEPSRGFGKAWRDNPTWRECLGPATSPAETPVTFIVQDFQHGRIVFDTFFNDFYALLLDGAGQPAGFVSLD